MKNSFYDFLSDGISFRSSGAMQSRLTYAPLCGIDGLSLKSSISPFLSGDSKIDKSMYVLKPASREDLRQPVRNFFVAVAGKGVFSFHGAAAAEDFVEMGQLWHRVVRHNAALGLVCEALTFIPVTGETLELTRFTVRNVGVDKVTLQTTAATALFARALANKHDHEHVTALLNRIVQLPEGVLVEPTMLFNEEGHRPGKAVYYVFGRSSDGLCPKGSFPTVESFLGEAGVPAHPRAVQERQEPRLLAQAERDGREAMGALRFADVVLAPGEEKSFIVGVGIAADQVQALAAFQQFSEEKSLLAALKVNAEFWSGKTAAVTFTTADTAFASWMRWVALQPVLRRIFGCSFLPDHDYGKGGKGWRDIWQDLLSLILIEPGDVRGHLLNNFGGVRIDGSNATIIGQQPGEFVADRNAITRVWMDHGVWPFMTARLYIDQTGDVDFLFEPVPYFSDPQWSRSLAKNAAWSPAAGNQLKDINGGIYRGTVLEHLLVQHLVQFFNVGKHNITRLEGADWNDGLDMAHHQGECVTFMACYAGNLLAIADFLETIAVQKGLTQIVVCQELLFLLDTIPGGTSVSYDDAAAKQERLLNHYFSAVQPAVSGVTVEVLVSAVCADLRRKGVWVFEHIRAQEKVKSSAGIWFNGYYDNTAVQVEGLKEDCVRMTLTGQVFPVMSGLANEEEITAVIAAVEAHLYDAHLGGYRLNTDFGMRTYLSMGRAFGFAFGTKENGAVFSHMVVMYAYALYKRGFSRQGHKVLQSLYLMSRHPQRAGIYPGVPEYFDGMGRGMYHFLTGSASWYVLTLLTLVFGVRGDLGDLVLAPQLLPEEFAANGEAGVVFQFAGRPVVLTYINVHRKDAGRYQVADITLNGKKCSFVRVAAGARLSRDLLTSSPGDLVLRVDLG